jgi:hypothetical protein
MSNKKQILNQNIDRNAKEIANGIIEYVGEGGDPKVLQIFRKDVEKEVKKAAEQLKRDWGC